MAVRVAHLSFFPFLFPFSLESLLERSLGLPLSPFAFSFPERYADVKEITMLSLQDSCLTTLPDVLRNLPPSLGAFPTL